LQLHALQLHNQSARRRHDKRTAIEQKNIQAAMPRATDAPSSARLNRHVPVMVIWHHGSEHNMTPEFGRRVSADHYIFCGNGENTNPELSVLDAVLASRTGAKKVRALSPDLDQRPFTFWFSTTSAHQKKPKPVAHMQRVEAWAAKQQERFPNVFTAKFVSGNVDTLSL
jgi:hypothetical protein